MPKRKPLTTCLHMSCRNLVRSGYCKEHKPKVSEQRESSSKRGYGYRWQVARKKFLAENPWCAECKRNSKHVPANQVDHIIPHKGNQKLFWDKSNWQSMCSSCHSQKTASEDGGFGNQIVK